RDLVTGILVVGVGVHDDVGAEPEAGVEAGHEHVGEALPPREAHEVVGTDLARDARGRVRRPVVDHEDLDHVHAGDRARDRTYGVRERGFLVQARDLDDELHGPTNGSTALRNAVSSWSVARTLLSVARRPWLWGARLGTRGARAAAPGGALLHLLRTRGPPPRDDSEKPCAPAPLASRDRRVPFWRAFALDSGSGLGALCPARASAFRRAPRSWAP